MRTTSSQSNNCRRKRQRAAADPNAFAFTIDDAQRMGAPGRTKIYELIAAGRLESVVVAGRRMIVGDSLRRLLGAS
jgi:hypothetical protein